MIHAVTFTNRYGRSLRCVLAAPEFTRFAIKNITGLGPGQASINIHEIATTDGGYYGYSRFSKRNIVVNFLLTDNDENGRYVPIEETRHLAYEFFAPKTPIQVLVETDARALVIEGYIESCEPEIFSNQESIQVSILCPGYYFKMVTDGDAIQRIRVYGNGLFEFPFSNESLTKKLIQFGSVTKDEKFDLYYDGDSENGFTLEIAFMGDGYPVTGNIKIINSPKGNTAKGSIGFGHDDSTVTVPEWTDPTIQDSFIEISMSTLATKLQSVYQGNLYDEGNKIVICTIPGKKSARFIAGNDSYNILGYLPHLEWMKLQPGNNEINVQTNAASAGHFYATLNFECLYLGA